MSRPSCLTLSEKLQTPIQLHGKITPSEELKAPETSRLILILCYENERESERQIFSFTNLFLPFHPKEFDIFLISFQSPTRQYTQGSTMVGSLNVLCMSFDNDRSFNKAPREIQYNILQLIVEDGGDKR